METVMIIYGHTTEASFRKYIRYDEEQKKDSLRKIDLSKY